MPPIPPPPGRRPLNLNNKMMETQYNLKTGPGRKDTLSHKIFNKTEMMCVARSQSRLPRPRPFHPLLTRHPTL
jgi:hypothetical protein